MLMARAMALLIPKRQPSVWRVPIAGDWYAQLVSITPVFPALSCTPQPSFNVSCSLACVTEDDDSRLITTQIMVLVPMICAGHGASNVCSIQDVTTNSPKLYRKSCGTEHCASGINDNLPFNGDMERRILTDDTIVSLIAA
jgi:hypothetical protein